MYMMLPNFMKLFAYDLVAYFVFQIKIKYFFSKNSETLVPAFLENLEDPFSRHHIPTDV